MSLYAPDSTIHCAVVFPACMVIISPCAASYSGLDIQCCVNYVQTEIIKLPVVCLGYVA